VELLAIKGGQPIREELLPYGRHWINDEDINAVIKVLKGDYLTTGPMIKEFEKSFAEKVNAEYAVAVSNGTAALHAACYAAGIREGDEVITTPLTFAASANCILYQGATPVFADIDPETYNIDIKEIEKKITTKTKAIIPVDFTGQPVLIDEIINLARRNNLIVIEDAAHSLGASYKNKKIGSIADMTEFSLHPVKHVTTGEGGVVTTNSKELYDKLSLFRSHGITRDPNIMLANEGPWYYEQLELGFNYRMTDIQASLGISQLNRLDSFVDRRKEIADKYNEAFKEMEELISPYQKEGCESSWHLYIIQLKLEHLNASRKEIFEALRAENIGVNVHYIPVYYLPYYHSLGYSKGICPNAENLYERIITLPLYPMMSEDDIKDVIKAVKKVINYFRK